MKIKWIKLKAEESVILPDGSYIGDWGGYVINIKVNGQYYELTTDDGAMGFGIKVIVEVKEGIATFKEVNN